MTDTSTRTIPSHFQIYFGLLLAMAVSLPLSKALMSIVPGFLMVNWLIEGQFKLKLQRFRESKSLILLISVFFVYIIGLLWTNSLKWGLHDIKIQLPLFVLPLVIGTSQKLNFNQVKQILYVFTAAVVVSSFCSIWFLLGFSERVIQNPREMSLFISHIRFALLINISIFSIGWYLMNAEKSAKKEKLLLACAIIWLSVFLVILKSATGWVVFIVVLSVVLFYNAMQIKKVGLKILLLIALLLLFLIPASYIGNAYRQFYSLEKIPANLDSAKTVRGNFYSNDLNNKQLENGRYTFLYINDNELREIWNKHSKLNYDSTYPSGYNKYGLYRYLSSKGYRKDAEGLEKLSDKDIRNIENGMTNYRFEEGFSFYNRIYLIIWELDDYRKGGNPSGHSVAQRLEYYKMASEIIREHFWFGNGTGGYYMAYQEKYDQNKFFQNDQFRQRSHNMFLSYWIDFGLIGLIYICFAMFTPVFIEKRTNHFLLMVFLLILVISFMNEDTLNNHDAISFFAFFYPLYLFSKDTTPNAETKT